MQNEPMLCVQDLSVRFKTKYGSAAAVNHVSFSLKKGEKLGLVGESGSGKTTIGRAIMRILPTSGGQVLYKGQQINGKISHALDRQVIKEMQMIFQDPQSSLNERAKVSYIVGEGLQNVRPDLSTAQQEEKVRQALLDVGLLPEFASRFPHEFSGGQRQRIGIARALAMEPKIILADEPVSALDVSIQAQIINLLKELRDKLGLTIIFISHDLSVVRYIADRIVVMYLGRIVEQAPAETLFEHPMHPYTIALLKATPEIRPEQHGIEKPMLEGEPPSPVHLPKGCPFAGRCRYRLDQCEACVPELKNVAEDHAVRCINLQN